MATWRRCEKCRKVLSENAFDGDAAMCTACSTAPVKAPRTTAAVTTRRVAPSAAPAPAAAVPSSATVVDRAPRQGVVGRGDPEVRARRARARALQELSDLHAEDFERLLVDARRAEGLI